MEYIAISGNIGVGKTTLSEKLSKDFNLEKLIERVDNNPYFNDFYKDMHKWAFNLQIRFLTNRMISFSETFKKDKSFIQDRTIYEDCEIFAKTLRQQNILSERDFDTYYMLYKFLISKNKLPKPTLLIYLRSDVGTLVERIKKRSQEDKLREGEDKMNIDYLYRLNERYEVWYNKYDGKKIAFNANELDFIKKTEHYSQIANDIQLKLNPIQNIN